MKTQTFENYKEEIDERIIRMYSKGTKIDFLTSNTKLNIAELSQILSGMEYNYFLVKFALELLPSYFQLEFIKIYVKPPSIYPEDFTNMIRTYHLNKDYRYFKYWMEEYYADIEKKSKSPISKIGYEFTATKDDIQIPAPGETIYQIGYYKNNHITIDEMIKMNWKYALYIISQFDNSPYENIFYYIYMKLKDLKDRNIIDVNLETCIPLKTLKQKYESTYGKYEK